MTLFGNVIVAVVKHFFVKQAECLKDRRLYILLKTCVSQQLSWQSGVNTQEQWRSKGLVLTLRLHWMLLQLKKKKPTKKTKTFQQRNLLLPQEGQTNPLKVCLP